MLNGKFYFGRMLAHDKKPFLDTPLGWEAFQIAIHDQDFSLLRFIFDFQDKLKVSTGK
jgi:hypothetical protein